MAIAQILISTRSLYIAPGNERHSLTLETTLFVWKSIADDILFDLSRPKFRIINIIAMIASQNIGEASTLAMTLRACNLP